MSEKSLLQNSTTNAALQTQQLHLVEKGAGSLPSSHQ
jgi:hypothetical protein